MEQAGLLAFRREDYLRGSEGPLKQAVWDKVAALGGDAEPGGGAAARQRALPQVYFSPVNFYFCDRAGRPATCWRRSPTPPGTSATTTCWIWRRSSPMTRIFMSPLHGTGDALAHPAAEEEALIHIESHPHPVRQAV